MASYGTLVGRVIRQSDRVGLEKLLKFISPNACNKFGESIVHSVCRRGDVQLLQTLLSAGATVQVSDDYGRTPLHDACWQSSQEPCLITFQTILEYDKDLIRVKDIRGATPLMYVRKDNHKKWIEFLSNTMDVFWPAAAATTTTTNNNNNNDTTAPKPKRMPQYQNQHNDNEGLWLNVIQMVSNGQISIEEAQKLLDHSQQIQQQKKEKEEEEQQQQHSQERLSVSSSCFHYSTNKISILDSTTTTSASCGHSSDSETLSETWVSDDDDSSYYYDSDDDDDFGFDQGELSDILKITAAASSSSSK